MNMHSYTLKSPKGSFSEIKTDVGVYLPTGDLEAPEDNIYHCIALWDTGATNSVISSQTVIALGLKPTGGTNVNHAGGQSYSNTYLVDIYLPNKVRFHSVRVTECPDVTGSFGVIIGMDIIRTGDFSFTNVAGNSTFSFRYPSFKEIDYVQEYNEVTKIIKEGNLKLSKGIKKCPCGSGKDFKNCHQDYYEKK